MPDILQSGQWETRTVSPRGAVELSLVSPVPARLEALGTATRPKHLGASRDALAFPASAVVSGRPVSVRAVCGDDGVFPGDCTVDLAVDCDQGAQSLIIRGIPVAGHSSAPLLQLDRQDGVITVRPGEGGNATLGLGGWLARRSQEAGQALAPTITELVVDTSPSMRHHQERVEALTRFLSDLYTTVGAPPLRLTRASINGADRDGVGAVAPGPAPQGRRVVITDLPLEAGAAESIVIGDPTLAQALHGPGAPFLIPDQDAWHELLRRDPAFTSHSLEALAALAAWICQPSQQSMGVAR
ncbi:hypothetical protein [Actinomyces bowdenii]|nr:hypothetical protein [Actinomyces bowdenii]